MDSTTATFAAVLIIAFVFLRWFVNSEEPDLASPLDQHDVATGAAPPRAQQPVRRPVTTDMIEVVHSIAPHLSEAQIRHDLQRTGSVQETVERVLNEGTLPLPPGYVEPQNDGGDERNKVDNIKAENLLKKYNVDESASSSGVKTQWSDSAEVRAKSLQEKKAEMILKARKRLESQLKNEQDLSELTE
jgi:coupling of ubiquitin conjugation to ER degradation protein 1